MQKSIGLHIRCMSGQNASVARQTTSFTLQNAMQDMDMVCISVQSHVLRMLTQEKQNTMQLLQSAQMRAEIYKKRVATCLKTYGVENVSQSKEIAQKMSASMLAKTEEELHERMLKTKATKLLRHGGENWQNHEKMKQTIANRTDEQRKQILEKKKDTCRKKYGVEFVMQVEDIKNRSNKARTALVRSKTYQTFLDNEHIMPLFSKDKYITSGFEQQLQWKCRHCGAEFLQFIGEHQLAGHYVRCLKCFPLNINESHPEKEILKIVENICGPDIEVKSRCRDIIKPKELDIYIPSKKIAIEFNGIFWHSTDFPDQEVNMHLEKTLRCEKLGIHLVHIFEHEWINDKDNVVALLRNTLIGEKTDNDVQLKNNSVEKSTNKVSIKKEDAYEAIVTKKNDDCTLRLKNLNYAYDINDIIEDAYNRFKQNMNEEITYVQIDRAKFCVNDFTDNFNVVCCTSPRLLIWDRNFKEYDLKEVEENVQYDNARYAHDCGDIILEMKTRRWNISSALANEGNMNKNYLRSVNAPFLLSSKLQ